MMIKSKEFRTPALLLRPNAGNLLFYLSAILSSIFTGIFVVLVIPKIPPLYLLLGFSGLIFAYLLFFHIDIGVICALFILYETHRFNYLGGGTPYHPNGLLGIAIIGATIFFFLSHRIHLSQLPGIFPFISFLFVCIFSLMFTGRYFMEGLTITLRLMTAMSIYAVLVYKLDSLKMLNWTIFAIAGSQISPIISKLLMLYRGEFQLQKQDLLVLGPQRLVLFYL
jgi:hypothetical protein